MRIDAAVKVRIYIHDLDVCLGPFSRILDFQTRMEHWVKCSESRHSSGLTTQRRCLGFGMGSSCFVRIASCRDASPMTMY